jgi:hypothetical protein
MTKSNIRRYAAVLLGAAALTLTAPAYALFGEKAVTPPVVPKAGDEATKSALAKEFLLLNFAKAGARLVAVGEYGMCCCPTTMAKLGTKRNLCPQSRR